MIRRFTPLFSCATLLTVLFGSFFLAPQITHATTATCNADINSDGIVDLADYSVLVSNFFASPIKNPRSDITGDGTVDIGDYSVLVSSFFMSCTTTVTPTPVPNPGEWTQFGSDSQKTNYAATIPVTPWKYKWQWNGAGADGKKQAGHLSVPDFVQPITGGNRVYMIAANQVFALDRITGAQVWTKGSIGTL